MSAHSDFCAICISGSREIIVVMYLVIGGIVCLVMGIAMPIYEGFAVKGWPEGIWKISLGLIVVGLLALTVIL